MNVKLQYLRSHYPPMRIAAERAAENISLMAEHLADDEDTNQDVEDREMKDREFRRNCFLNNLQKLKEKKLERKAKLRARMLVIHQRKKQQKTENLTDTNPMNPRALTSDCSLKDDEDANQDVEDREKDYRKKNLQKLKEKKLERKAKLRARMLVIHQRKKQQKTENVTDTNPMNPRALTSDCSLKDDEDANQDVEDREKDYRKKNLQKLKERKLERIAILRARMLVINQQKKHQKAANLSDMNPMNPRAATSDCSLKAKLIKLGKKSAPTMPLRRSNRIKKIQNL